MKALKPTTNITTSLVFLLFLFQSSSQTAIFCLFFFFTLKTQPCTIQSSKSLLLQPQLKIVYPKPHLPVTHCPFSKMGGGGEGLLRYARWISSFTKLDNNKSNNNNDNNLKSNIFCLCSILLIHINRGIFFHTTCTGLHIQKIGMYRSNHRKRGTSAASLGPKIHLCAHSSDLYMGQGPKVTGSAELSRQATHTYRTHTYTEHLAVVLRTDCVGPHTECCVHRLSVQMKECPKKPDQESRIQECRETAWVCWIFLFFSSFEFPRVQNIYRYIQ